MRRMKRGKHVVNSRDLTEIKKGLQTGEIKVVCGTHAVIQGDVSFKNLALAVCDEQHRFGVAVIHRARKNTDSVVGEKLF